MPHSGLHAIVPSVYDIVVIRDRELNALQHPEPFLLGRAGSVRVEYVWLASQQALPQAHTYVFNLERLAPAETLVSDLARRGASVTLVLSEIDDAVLALAALPNVSVIPAYGEVEHIGRATAKSALRLACRGQQVVARGYLENSVASRRAAHQQAPHTFVRALVEASCAADRQRVVAAVVSPHRSGSKFLRDLIGVAVGARVQVVHEHAVPLSDQPWNTSRPTFDQLSLSSVSDFKRLRASMIRDALLSAERRYVFVAEREPVERLQSYFVKRKARWLRERLTSEGTFVDPGEVQREWDDWVPDMCAIQRRWYQEVLRDQLGVDVMQAELTEDGLLHGRFEAGELLVVATRRLDDLRAAVEAEYGPLPPLAANSAGSLGNKDVGAAVRRCLVVSPETRADLLAIPELAHIRSRLSI